MSSTNLPITLTLPQSATIPLVTQPLSLVSGTLTLPAEHMNNLVQIYDREGVLQSEFLVTSPRTLYFSNVNFSKIILSDITFSYSIFLTYKIQQYSTQAEYESNLEMADFQNEFIPFTATPVFAFGSVVFPTANATDNNGNKAAYYVPITISNNESSATGSNFAQLISFTPSDISSYINPNCQNIFFGDANGTLYNSWIENATSSTTSGAVNIWVQVPNINPNSSITIYMYIDATTSTLALSGKNTGAQPGYTSTYGEYDNGADVFLIYLNGNTPTTDFNVASGLTLAQATGITLPDGNTGNVLNITGYNGTNELQIGYTVGTSVTSIIAESNFQEYTLTGTSQGPIVIANSPNITTSTNAIDVEIGYDSSYFSQAYISGGSLTYDQNQQGTYNTNWNYASVQTIAGTSSFYGYIAPQLYSTSGGYSGTVSANPVSGATELYIGFGIIKTSSSHPWNTYINWARGRTYPPAGVMPSATFGTLVVIGGGSITIFPQNTGLVYFCFTVQNTTGSAITLSIQNNTTGEYVINEDIPPDSLIPSIEAYDTGLILNQQYTYTFNGAGLSYFTVIARETY
jgi:hypothetical protein